MTAQPVGVSQEISLSAAAGRSKLPATQAAVSQEVIIIERCDKEISPH